MQYRNALEIMKLLLILSALFAASAAETAYYEG